MISQIDAICGFRKNDIIPIGKLQRSLDESESESEALSETEGTASPEQMSAGPPLAPVTTVDDQIRLDWTRNDGQELSGVSGEISGVDLDADVEDLDGQVPDEDYSQQMMHDEDVSEEHVEGDSSVSYAR